MILDIWNFIWSEPFYTQIGLACAAFWGVVIGMTALYEWIRQ